MEEKRELGETINTSEQAVSNKFEKEARRFFATVKNELKEISLDELLLRKTRNDLKIMTSEFDIAAQKESALDFRLKLYGGVIHLSILIILLTSIVISAYFRFKIASIICIALTLVYLLTTNLTKVSGQSWEERVAYWILAKKLDEGKLNFENQHYNADLEEAKAEGESLNAEIESLAKKTEFFKLVPKRYWTLYRINRLYAIAREGVSETVSETYELLDAEIEAEQEEDLEEQRLREERDNRSLGK